MTTERRVGYLKKDRLEHFTMRRNRRAWFVNAWRIVNAQGIDLIQPWPNTKTEAREISKHCNISLNETAMINN